MKKIKGKGVSPPPPLMGQREVRHKRDGDYGGERCTERSHKISPSALSLSLSLSLPLTLTSYIQISGGDKILSSNFADRQTDPSRRPDRRKRALGKLDVNRH